MPSTEDFLLLAFPLEAWATGVYRRFGNQVRQETWADLCLCRPDSETPGWTFLWRSSIVNTGTRAYLAAVGPAISENATKIRAVLEQHSGLPTKAVGFYMGTPATAGDYTSTAWWGTGGGGSLDFLADGSPRFPDGQDITSLRAAVGTLVVGAGFDYAPAGATATIRFEWYGPTSPTPVEPPEAPTAPTGYPASPTPPVCDDLGDVCAALSDLGRQMGVLDQKVSYIASVLPPVDAITDDAVVSIGDEQLVKPTDAIGAVITLAIPPYMGRFGGDPLAYWSAGWASLVTAEGYLPSMRLKHSPQVLWPIPPRVKRVAFDLAPGVSATLQWMRAPK